LQTKGRKAGGVWQFPAMKIKGQHTRKAHAWGHGLSLRVVVH